MGHRESALRRLDKAYAEHAGHPVLLTPSPLFDGPRFGQRFSAFLTLVGFTPYPRLENHLPPAVPRHAPDSGGDAVTSLATSSASTR